MYAYVWWKKLRYFLANLCLFFVIIFKVEIFWLAFTEMIKGKSTTQVIKDVLLNFLKVGHLLWLDKWVGAGISESAVKEQLEETEGGVTSQRDNSNEQLRAHFLS